MKLIFVGAALAAGSIGFMLAGWKDIGIVLAITGILILMAGGIVTLITKEE